MNYKKLFILGITCSILSCTSDEYLVKDKDVTNSIKKTVLSTNLNFKKISQNLSKLENLEIFKKISENALKRYYGDKNFIYNKDKYLLKTKSVDKIEKDVDVDELKNPYLNIYVYRPFNKENMDLKPYIFYFPVGKKDTEVDYLIGFIDGKEVKIDAKNPPSEDIKNPIFVVGENERMHEVDKVNEFSFAVNNKNYSVKKRYINKNYNKKNTRNNLIQMATSDKMRVTFSKFTSMSAKRHYEPWGKGDAEVRFIFTKAEYALNSSNFIYPIKALKTKTTTALIDGGYIYRRWVSYYSKDNKNRTNYFVDFKPLLDEFDVVTSYNMKLIEEDRYWGWVSWLLKETEKITLIF